jgi:WD40 repeat protein
LLPVYFLPGYSLVDVSKYEDNSAWQKQHIHVNLNNTNSYVLVGKMGLLGGMIRKEWDNNSMPQAQRQAQQGVFSDIDTKRDKIGEGGFATVYQATWQRKNDVSIPVAVKSLRDIGNDEALSKETTIMKKLRHNNIVRFYGIHNIKIGNNRVDAIITELMSEGSVEGFLKKASKSSIKPMSIVSMALDAAQGMRYLHENKIIHRDLAARNLLLTLSNGKYLVKVGDFGLSKEQPSNQEGVSYSSSVSVNSDRDPARWSAPELFTRKKISRRSDVWSFGVVLYELFNLCQVKPYKDLDREKIIGRLKSGEKMYQYLSIPECPKGIQELVNQCMDNDKKARPIFNKIINKLEKIRKEESSVSGRPKGSSQVVRENSSSTTGTSSSIPRGRARSLTPQIKTEDKGASSGSVSTKEESSVSGRPRGFSQVVREISNSTTVTSKPISKGRAWSLTPQIKTIGGHIKGLVTLIELSDGHLASGSRDHTIKIWDRAGNCINTLKGHTNTVCTLIELLDGNLASSSMDHTIKIWDRAGKCINTFKGHTGFVGKVIELSDKFLASCSFDNLIKIWDKAAGQCVKTLNGHTSAVHTLTKLSDGCLASGSSDKTIKIWDKAGKCITTLEGHTYSVNTLTELSDGLLASGSRDHTIKIWDRAGKCINTLNGHKGDVQTLIELSDGLIASGSMDNTIKIWDRAGKCITTLEGHTDWVETLTELSDGCLASGSCDKTIKVWDLPKLN